MGKEGWKEGWKEEVTWSRCVLPATEDHLNGGVEGSEGGELGVPAGGGGAQGVLWGGHTAAWVTWGPQVSWNVLGRVTGERRMGGGLMNELPNRRNNTSCTGR